MAVHKGDSSYHNLKMEWDKTSDYKTLKEGILSRKSVEYKTKVRITRSYIVLFYMPIWSIYGKEDISDRESFIKDLFLYQPMNSICSKETNRRLQISVIDKLPHL